MSFGVGAGFRWGQQQQQRRSLSRFEPSTGFGLQRGAGDSLGLVPRLKERRLRTRSGASCRSSSPSLRALGELLFHELAPVHSVCRMAIVGPTGEPDPVDGVALGSGVAVEVIELVAAACEAESSWASGLARCRAANGPDSLWPCPEGAAFVRNSVQRSPAAVADGAGMVLAQGPRMNNRILSVYVPSVVLFAVLGCGGPESELEESADGVGAGVGCSAIDADLARCVSLAELCFHTGTPSQMRSCVWAAPACMLAWSDLSHECAHLNPTTMKVYRARISFLGIDEDSLVPMDRVIESFTFALSPQPNADARPFWRCLRTGTNIDFTTHSPTCNGNGTPISQHGYSFAADTPGARPVYSCRRASGDDRFLSRRADCEGAVVIGLLGYAK